jgi:hypothetical protein
MLIRMNSSILKPEFIIFTLLGVTQHVDLVSVLLEKNQTHALTSSEFSRYPITETLQLPTGNVIDLCGGAGSILDTTTVWLRASR